MNWSSWSDFAAMGGYGFYVWGSFGLTAAVVAAEVCAIHLRRRALTHSREAVAGAEAGEGR